MTKEEVAAIVTYCQENNVSYKQRLAELNIRPSSFYDAKRKNAPKEDGENDVDVLFGWIVGRRVRGDHLKVPLRPDSWTPIGLFG